MTLDISDELLEIISKMFDVGYANPMTKEEWEEYIENLLKQEHDLD